MPSTVVVVCPSCENKLKIPDEYVGKKIRCKKCTTVFAAKPARAPAPAKATVTEPKPEPVAVADQDSDDIDSDKAYGLGGMDLTPRCPTCAAELESENQVICLSCGYNLRTRVKVETKKIYETETGDVINWLLPGIGCLVAVIVLIVIDIICWVNMTEWCKGSILEKEGGGWYLKPGAFTFYIVLASAFIIIPCAKFAFKRLVIDNKPPEQIKKK